MLDTVRESEEEASPGSHRPDRLADYLRSVRDRRLARFLAEFRVEDYRPTQVVELGCGAGAATPLIAEVLGGAVDYVGFDIEDEAVARGTALAMPGFRFQQIDLDGQGLFERLSRRPDMILALDTFAYLHPRTWHVLASGAALRGIPLFVSVPNEVGPAVALRYAGSRMLGRDTGEYSLSDAMHAMRGRFDRLPRHAGGRRGFDWRALSHTLRQYHDITIATSPLGLVPPSFSPSLFFTCRVPR